MVATTEDQSMIDISQFEKADVLAALYEFAKPQGMGFLHYTPLSMSRTEAVELLANQTYFDYLHGRAMKVDLSGDTLNPRLYDRDNGEGIARQAIDILRLALPLADGE